MNQRNRRKRLKGMKRKYKRLIAAIAGAAIMSSAMLPGIPAASAQALPDPVDAPPAITLQDTMQNQTAVPGQKAETPPTNYEKVLDVKATAYAPGQSDNGKWGNKTHLGTTVRPGVLAVDPKIIPLGSKVYVQYPDGHGEYAVAEDTGGAIKGNRIDIAMSNREQAKNFGIRHVKVYVLSTPDKA